MLLFCVLLLTDMTCALNPRRKTKNAPGLYFSMLKGVSATKGWFPGFLSKLD